MLVPLIEIICVLQPRPSAMLANAALWIHPSSTVLYLHIVTRVKQAVNQEGRAVARSRAPAPSYKRRASIIM